LVYYEIQSDSNMEYLSLSGQFEQKAHIYYLFYRISLFFCYFVLYNSFVYGIISPEGFQSMGA